MKRTAFKRKVPVPVTPEQRQKPQRKCAVKTCRSLFSPLSMADKTCSVECENLREKKSKLIKLKKNLPKTNPHEIQHYKKVAALPCVRCGIEGYSQCAHSNKYSDGKGMGKKAHYLATFPLCCTRPGILGCHAEFDRHIGISNEESSMLTIQYIDKTLRLLGIGNYV